ncbi:hypothetical protein ACFFX0_06580 [Citricoccus parietis]|uniref:Secreted protein n=1 Tax=Citricoccus parietis TaxID=592307 RepID=A0ABV5FW28_9MICC
MRSFFFAGLAGARSSAGPDAGGPAGACRVADWSDGFVMGVSSTVGAGDSRSLRCDDHHRGTCVTSPLRS